VTPEHENREPATPLADRAAERVRAIVEAAERQAAEIEAEARSEAERIVKAAREEAKEQVDKAQASVSRLVEQADELRLAVGRLGSDIASQVKPGGPSEAETPAPPEVDPKPPTVPEPTPPLEPEPTPPQTPEPTPPLEPEPTPPQTPEPQPPGPQIAAGSPSTDDLLAQLKGEAAPTPGGRSKPGNGDAGNGAAAESATDGDVAAARLIAMKMALDGASRDEIAIHLEDNFSLSSTDELLDDVLARARA
jgi:hypothetical protein